MLYTGRPRCSVDLIFSCCSNERPLVRQVVDCCKDDRSVTVNFRYIRDYALAGHRRPRRRRDIVPWGPENDSAHAKCEGVSEDNIQLRYLLFMVPAIKIRHVHFIWGG